MGHDILNRGDLFLKIRETFKVNFLADIFARYHLVEDSTRHDEILGDRLRRFLKVFEDFSLFA